MSNSGASIVHSFASIVENAIRSVGGDLGAFPLHDFSLAVENAWSSIGGDFRALPVHGFASIVDNAMRSFGGDMGALPVHGFASAVEIAMRSTRGDLRALPVHGFASTVENAMRSTSGDLGMSHSPVPGFQLFTLVEVAAATNNFSAENRIFAGSSSVVYRGKLVDGSEVAIERVENGWSRTHEEGLWWRRMFSSSFLPGLRPKNLVGMVGLCVETCERVLVYEYEWMKNGSLHDHLDEKGSNVLNSWKMRIKIALDASRGIEYVHKYGFPCSVHGDIKASNIVVDATWTAKVCNFGKVAAGSNGYIDPEYSSNGVLTKKSDVYGFGIVLLELLTGKRAAYGEDGGTVLHVAFAEAAILGGDFLKILDTRIGEPHQSEAKAVELVAHTAINCVNVVGKLRPTISQVVINLERVFDYLWY